MRTASDVRGSIDTDKRVTRAVTDIIMCSKGLNNFGRPCHSPGILGS